jgi:hypothetical protein
MLNQPLYDKLIQLRLPAFRDGLQAQQDNPLYAPLSFEERLALLVDQECLRRHDHRIQRLLKVADFPLPATIEDLDLSPARGLDRRTILELAQVHWIHNHHHLFVPMQQAAEKPISPVPSATPLFATLTRALFSPSRLLHLLGEARQEGSYHTLLRSFAKIDAYRR